MSKKRKTDLPVYNLTCTRCGAIADGNTREADGWTVIPMTQVLCSTCNGNKATPVHFIKAKERGKFIPYATGGANGQ